MPIYEYRCGECNRKFEQIVLRGRALEEAACPRCGSHAVERILSSFAMSGVTRKSEESFDDEFDAPDEDFAAEAGEDLDGEEENGDEEDDEDLDEEDEDSGRDEDLDDDLKDDDF